MEVRGGGYTVPSAIEQPLARARARSGSGSGSGSSGSRSSSNNNNTTTTSNLSQGKQCYWAAKAAGLEENGGRGAANHPTPPSVTALSSPVR